MQEYCSRRLREGAARETVRKELVALRRALSLAAQRGLLRSDPAALIPRFRAAYTRRRRWLTQKDFERLLVPFTPKRRRWLLLATFGGCRLSELEGLRSAMENRCRMTIDDDAPVPTAKHELATPAHSARSLVPKRP